MIEILVVLLGSKLLIRMWDSFVRAVAGLVAPWQARRAGAVHIEIHIREIVLRAHAERRAEEIKCGLSSAVDGRQVDGV